MKRLAFALVLLAANAVARAQSCGDGPMQLQILGSGGADLAEERAAPSALIWLDGKARLLIDAGPGAALRFNQAEAQFAELDAVLLTHLRADRSADFPAIIQLPTQPPRTRPLPVYGPSGNRWMPSTVTFVRTLFDPTRGVWRHLGDVLSPLARTSYKLEPHDLRPLPSRLSVTREQRDEPIPVFEREDLRVSAITATNNQTPMLAWRIESRGKKIVIGVHHDSLRRLAQGADVLVAAHVTGDSAALGQLATEAKVTQLILTQRTRATMEKEDDAAKSIRRHYEGALEFADDFDCVSP